LGTVLKLGCRDGGNVLRVDLGLPDRRRQTANDCAKAKARSVDSRRPIRPFLSRSLVTAHMHSILRANVIIFLLL
jgi:hypothetical protein